MVSTMQIRGKLSQDIGFLMGEIRRLSAMVRTMKERLAELERTAEEGKKYTQEAIPQLRQGRLNPVSFKQKSKQEITTLGTEIGKIAVVDGALERECYNAKNVLDQMRRVFSHALHSQWFSSILAEAEEKTVNAERELEIMRNDCVRVIHQGIDPFIDNVDNMSLNDLINRSKLAYEQCHSLAQAVNAGTRRSIGQVLKFYGTLYQRYPLLVHEAWEVEKHYPPVRKRLLE